VPPCLTFLLRWSLHNFLPKLVSNSNPSDLYLPSSQNYWHEPLHLVQISLGGRDNILVCEIKDLEPQIYLDLGTQILSTEISLPVLLAIFSLHDFILIQPVPLGKVL
jgi:hypothetical protein